MQGMSAVMVKGVGGWRVCVLSTRAARLSGNVFRDAWLVMLGWTYLERRLLPGR
jgi:hypothetical protein